jgi:hypothetical protein
MGFLLFLERSMAEVAVGEKSQDRFAVRAWRFRRIDAFNRI